MLNPQPIRQKMNMFQINSDLEFSLWKFVHDCERKLQVIPDCGVPLRTGPTREFSTGPELSISIRGFMLGTIG